MPGELVQLPDGGIGAKDCIANRLSNANTQSSSFVDDFFREPSVYFAGTVSLQDYLSHLSKDDAINLFDSSPVS